MSQKVHFRPVILCFLSLIGFYSCKDQKEYTQYIRQAEKLAWENPDSALSVLDLVDTISLGEMEKAQYDLALIMAQAKANMDFSSNDHVFKLLEYFKGTNDGERTALATFYTGRVYQLRCNYENANKYYLETYKLADQVNNSRLKGLVFLNIGVLDFNQAFYMDAIKSLNSSLPYLKQNQENTCIALTYIGNAYYILNQHDSAFRYFEKALKISEKSNNTALYSDILKNESLMLIDAGEYEKAKKYNLKELSLTDVKTKYVSLINLAWVYHYTGQEDSTNYYVDEAYKLQDKVDIFSSVAIYELLYQIEKEKKNYELALNFHEQLLDSLIVTYEKQEDLSILEVQKKFKTELLEQKLKIEKQRKYLWRLGVLLALSVGSFIVYLLVQTGKRKTEQLLKTIETLNKMRDSYNEKECNYRNVALEQFDILKKAALIDRTLKDSETINSKMRTKVYNITYGGEEFNWNKLYEVINTLQNGFMLKAESIFKEYTELDEVDFKIWCLSYSRFTQDEISVIFNKMSVRSIQQRNHDIRKAFNTNNIDKFIDAKIREKYPDN